MSAADRRTRPQRASDGHERAEIPFTARSLNGIGRSPQYPRLDNLCEGRRILAAMQAEPSVLSADPTLDANDIVLGQIQVSSLAVAATTDGTLVLRLPGTPEAPPPGLGGKSRSVVAAPRLGAAGPRGKVAR